MYNLDADEGHVFCNFFAISSLYKDRYKDARKNKLRHEIYSIKKDFDTALNNFDYVEDPEIIESLIFRIKSLEARYSYLLREAKVLYKGD